jgi:hypothetical protein
MGKNSLTNQALARYRAAGYFPVNFLLRATGRPACPAPRSPDRGPAPLRTSCGSPPN